MRSFPLCSLLALTLLSITLNLQARAFEFTLEDSYCSYFNYVLTITSAEFEAGTGAFVAVGSEVSNEFFLSDFFSLDSLTADLSHYYSEPLTANAYDVTIAVSIVDSNGNPLVVDSAGDIDFDAASFDLDCTLGSGSSGTTTSATYAATTAVAATSTTSSSSSSTSTTTRSTSTSTSTTSSSSSNDYGGYTTAFFPSSGVPVASVPFSLLTTLFGASAAVLLVSTVGVLAL